MKVKFTAEIIDDNGNVVGKRISERDGILSMEKFDLSTREGILIYWKKLSLRQGTRLDKILQTRSLTVHLKKLHAPEQETENRSRIRAWPDPCQCPGGYGTFHTAKGENLQHWLQAAVMQTLHKTQLQGCNRNDQSFPAP